MSFKKVKDNLLHIHNLRKALGYSVFQEAMKSKTKHEIIDNMPSGNVLVIAPHPDDDVFGCGGAIKLHTSRGDKLKIIYLTGKGTKREEEARKAAAILGVTDLEFLDLKDGAIELSKSTILQVNNLATEFKPKIIYAPSFLDPNKDHFACADTFNEVLKKKPFAGKIFLYEVWSPIYANRLLAIDNFFQAKVEAMSEHESQLKDRDYLDAMTGLARYRAGMFNAGRYAEAFFECNRELYLKLFKLM